MIYRGSCRERAQHLSVKFFKTPLHNSEQIVCVCYELYISEGMRLIIHFTKMLGSLNSILLSRSFRLSYCGEYFGDRAGKIISRAAHPMVSFSEYSDLELPTKVVTYGNYGIALNKLWAVKNGLSPVNYIEKNSQAAQGLIALLKARQRGALPSELRLPVMQLKCFTKHVYGFNSYFGKEGFDFKAENEWRFVPTRSQIGGNCIYLTSKPL